MRNYAQNLALAIYGVSDSREPTFVVKLGTGAFGLFC